MTNTLSRRSLLARTGLAAAGACLSSSLYPLLANPAERRFKIGACEWSLRKADPSCFEVARQIGLDGVQLNMGSLANRMWLRDPSVQKRYLDAAKAAGLQVGGLGLAEMNNIPLKRDLRAAAWLADSIDIAVALGIKVILVAQFFNGELKDDAPGTDRTVELLQDLAPKAERAGVIFGLENYLSAEENLAILDRVKSPAVQVYYDVGNSTDKGYDIYKEIRMLKGRLCEFHAKDAGFMLGQGRVDFQKVREAVEEIGFRGWIQIEAATPHDLVKDYQAHLAFLRGHFKD